MNERKDVSETTDAHSEAALAEQAARLHRKPEMAQHEMLDPNLPKRDVANSLEDFDGDEA